MLAGLVAAIVQVLDRNLSMPLEPKFGSLWVAMPPPAPCFDGAIWSNGKLYELHAKYANR